MSATYRQSARYLRPPTASMRAPSSPAGSGGKSALAGPRSSRSGPAARREKAMGTPSGSIRNAAEEAEKAVWSRMSESARTGTSTLTQPAVFVRSRSSGTRATPWKRGASSPAGKAVGPYQRICRSSYPAEEAYQAVKDFIKAAKASMPRVVASVVTVPQTDIEACRKIAEQELGVEFRVRGFQTEL